MCIIFNHIYLRRKISPACFKISYYISRWLNYLHSLINSAFSLEPLSFSLKEHVELDYLIHLSSKAGATSYSRTISRLHLPFKLSWTN